MWRAYFNAVGQVATEIVESWYGSRTFCFSHRMLNLIPDFLERDVFSKGLEPSLTVQHMHVHVDEYQTKTSYFDELRDTLGKVENKDVNLHMRLHHKTSMSARRLQLEKLGPVVYQLRREGLSRMTVQSAGCCKDFTSLFDVKKSCSCFTWYVAGRFGLMSSNNVVGTLGLDGEPQNLNNRWARVQCALYVLGEGIRVSIRELSGRQNFE